MTNYYLADLEVDPKHGVVRRFDSAQDAELWAKDEVIKPENTGPVHIDMVHCRSGRCEHVVTIKKEALQ